jgi:putative ATP-binding cassette transporter
MTFFRYTVRHAKGVLVATAVTGLLGGALAAATVATVAEALRTGTPTTELTLLFVVTAIAGAAMRYVSTDLLSRFSQRQLVERAGELSRHVLNAGLSNVEEIGASRLLVALTEDLAMVTNTITMLPPFVSNVAIVVACFAYVAWLSWPVMLIGTVCFGLAAFSYAWLMRRGYRLDHEVRQEHDELLGHYRALTDGFTELKLHRARRAAFLEWALDAVLQRIVSLNVSALRLFNAAATINQLMFFVVIGGLAFGVQWTSADTATTTGAILALLYARGPLDMIVQMGPTVVQAEVALARFESLMTQLPAEGAAERAAESAADRAIEKKAARVIARAAVAGVQPFTSCRQIELRGVEYEYTGQDQDPFRLGPVDLTIRAGEILFVTGGNGSGKSTLAKILAGLYTPTSGEIRLDGVTVSGANRDEYRQLISSIFTTFHLFPELLGLERPTLDREAGEWLTRMRLAQRVQVRHGLFSDLHLSTGQRKRIALLVAMLEDRPICIFDEWAADQDTQYRQEFYLRLLPELKARGKGVIIISHDDRYYAKGDRIVKLERGRMVANDAAAGFMAALTT